LLPVGAFGVPIGVVKFAEFELDSGRYELRCGNRVLKLEKIPMELLTLLVEGHGQLVSRDEIVEKIWGKDVFLDTEHGINTAIRKIRHVLEDDPEQPRFVQTVTGKGYRFIAAATSIDHVGNGGDGARERVALFTPPLPAETPLGNAEIGRSGEGIEPVKPVVRRSRWPIAALVVVVLAGVIVVLVTMNSSSTREGLFTRSVKPQIHSLAVLPLENLSGDPAQEYFADGMTDEVITMLAKNTGLRVVSRTSVMQYKKVHRPLADVARELGVDGILEGSVERSGNRVHINAQLIYAPKDMHLWAESYDRDLKDLTSLQSDLAQDIARQVGLTTAAIGRPERHINPEAHDAYLLGRYYWFAETDEYEKSRGYFQKAIDLQPDYAAAWSGLADSYALGAVAGRLPPEAVMPQAEAAAKKALELDDLDGEAHKSMAAIQLFYRWDWRAAERESARALELNPNFAEGHHLRAYVLRCLNRLDEAVQEERKTMELDPFAKPFVLGFALIRARQFGAALNEARIRSDAQPNNAGLHQLLSYAYFFNGMEKESEEESERYLQLAGEKDRLAEQVQVYRHGGFRAVLAWRVDKLKRTAAKQYVSPSDFADAYAELGRKEETIRYLEESYRERSPHLGFLQSDPNFDFLHSDPRYRAIIKKMGLPPNY
jgi:TolB-like protein/DNA-binding winged helix-turn-helix (wHTH) protein